MITNRELEVFAIIPARGGSKGLPRKNLQPVLGKPLVVHSIEHARSVPEITRVIVSTDDLEIESVAKRAGAEVVIRPPEISGDGASSEAALLHVLDTLAGVDREPDLVVFLQPTSPNRSAADISAALAILVDEDADSLLSVAPLHGFVWRLEKDGPRSLSYDFVARPRRQEVLPDVLENGSIYIFKPRLLRSTGNRLGGRIAVFQMGPTSYFQIDTTEDLEIVERLMVSESTCGPVPAEWAGINLLVLDFDGVLTDNTVHVDEDGRETVRCSRADGLGIADLSRAGVKVVVLSSEQSPVVGARCAKLQVPCIQGSRNKLRDLEQLASESGLSRDEVAYIGNDLNDAQCLRWAGVPIAVADAHPSAKAAADFVTARSGGEGAVREICDKVLQARGIGDDELGSGW